MTQGNTEDGTSERSEELLSGGQKLSSTLKSDVMVSPVSSSGVRESDSDDGSSSSVSNTVEGLNNLGDISIIDSTD